MGLRVFKTALRNNQKYRKKHIGDEFLFLFDKHCQYLNKIMSGIRLLEHVLYMNVSSHHSLILAKFGIRSLKISLKYFQNYSESWSSFQTCAILESETTNMFFTNWASTCTKNFFCWLYSFSYAQNLQKWVFKILIHIFIELRGNISPFLLVKDRFANCGQSWQDGSVIFFSLVPVRLWGILSQTGNTDEVAR